MVHTDPEELWVFKSYSNLNSKGEKKDKTEVDLCEIADHVVGIGPKLSEAYRSYLRGCQKDDHVPNFPGAFHFEQRVSHSVGQMSGSGNHCLFTTMQQKGQKGSP